MGIAVGYLHLKLFLLCVNCMFNRTKVLFVMNENKEYQKYSCMFCLYTCTCTRDGCKIHTWLLLAFNSLTVGICNWFSKYLLAVITKLHKS